MKTNARAVTLVTVALALACSIGTVEAQDLAVSPADCSSAPSGV
jgi:hypothetical protein